MIGLLIYDSIDLWLCVVIVKQENA